VVLLVCCLLFVVCHSTMSDDWALPPGLQHIPEPDHHQQQQQQQQQEQDYSQTQYADQEQQPYSQYDQYHPFSYSDASSSFASTAVASSTVSPNATSVEMEMEVVGASNHQTDSDASDKHPEKHSTDSSFHEVCCCCCSVGLGANGIA
jgi:hypothetical protein